MDDNEFVHEYNTIEKKGFLNFKKKPTNSLDYINFNSEKYNHWKIKEKIKLRLSSFNLNDKYINEIFEISILHKKKSNLRLSTIIPIVAYKVCQKNHLQVSYQELFDKLKFKKSKYIKYSKLIKIGGNEEDFEQSRSFEVFRNKIDNLLSFMIPRLVQLYETNPNLFKMATQEEIIDRIASNIIFNVDSEDYKVKQSDSNSNQYPNIAKIISEIRYSIRDSIDKHLYDKTEKRSISIQALTVALIKHFLKKSGVVTTLKTLSDSFQVSASNISKATKLIE
jgi:hypothetical protein